MSTIATAHQTHSSSSGPDIIIIGSWRKVDWWKDAGSKGGKEVDQVETSVSMDVFESDSALQESHGIAGPLVPVTAHR